MTEIDQLLTNPLTAAGPDVWRWEIPVYLFIGGLTAGIMVLGALLLRRPEPPSRWARWFPFLAAAALSLGMLALFLDLAYKRHVYRFYLAFEWTSPMSWGSWILLAIYPATLLWGVAELTESEVEVLGKRGPLAALRLGGLLRRAWHWTGSRKAALRWTNLGLGIALGGYTGILLSSLGAREVWSSSVLGPLFLVSGVSTGAALMMLFPLRRDERHQLRDWDIWAIAVELALLALFLLGLATGGEAARRAAALFLGGPYTATFWSLVVIAGLLVPLLLETIEAVRKLRPTVLAPVLLLIGGLSLRWILVVAGQSV